MAAGNNSEDQKEKEREMRGKQVMIGMMVNGINRIIERVPVVVAGSHLESG